MSLPNHKLFVGMVHLTVGKDQDPTMLEMDRKFQAKVLLLDHSIVIVPSEDEWIGVNLLERDDELRRMS